jgi:hypothetical protein
MYDGRSVRCISDISFSNTSPALTISQPDGVGDTIAAGSNYNITYTMDDPDDVVTAAFYYDTDNAGLNGTAIIGSCAAAAEGTGVICSASNIPVGSYYIYGIVSDGVNPQVSAYSSGKITVYEPCIGTDHGGLDWTPSDNDVDGYDLNPAVGTIEIAGVHCNINNFSIPAGRTVYVKAYDGVNYGKVEINANNGDIAATGVLNAVGKGYASDLGPGSGNLGSNSYGSINNPNDMGSGGETGAFLGRRGAGYGGRGGSGTSACCGTPPTGGAGGGMIKLVISNAFTLDGAINVSASNATGNRAGGSGGTIYIDTASLAGAGTGSMIASGGTAGNANQNGGGGGGRIAYYYNINNYVGSIAAYGGAPTGAAVRGGAGTIFWKSKTDVLNPNGYLKIDNNGLSGEVTPLPVDMIIDTLTVQNGARLSIDAGVNLEIKNTGAWSFWSIINNGSFLADSVTDLTIINTLNNNGFFSINGVSTLNLNGNFTNAGNFVANNVGLTNLIINGTVTVNSFSPTTTSFANLKDMTVNGTLSHLANTNAKVNYIDLTLDNLTINPGGKIDVTGKGFAADQGPGSGNTGGNTYGSVVIPVDLGSGGKTGSFQNNTAGGYGGAGGNGGGAFAGGGAPSTGGGGGGFVRLNINNILRVDGSIIASGGNATGPRAGGSGGTVFIISNNFNGLASSSIVANGGNGGSVNGNGGGGGGRITDCSNTFTYAYNGTKNAAGGLGMNGGVNGQSGTVFRCDRPTVINLNVVGPVNNCTSDNKYDLSWTYQSNTTPQFAQKSYQIRAYNDPAKLPANEILNSGVVVSSSTTHSANFGISAYNKTLYWDLKVWDETDILSSSVTDGPNFTTAPAKPACVAENSNVQGFAWSENIGWLSFSYKNCDTDGDYKSEGVSGCPVLDSPIPAYGVDLDIDILSSTYHDLSGYAWSENIGWISFNWGASGLIGDTFPLTKCPSGDDDTLCQPKLTGSNFSGWARACSVFQLGCTGALKPASETGGWDGWISLRKDLGNMTKGAAMGAWSDMRKVKIANSGAAQNNYQVSITLDSASLISDGKMQADCRDIRFTDSDKNTLLSYWIESGCNTTDTKIWIKAASIVNPSTDIYLYYGNPAAAIGSNYDNTFTKDYSEPGLVGLWHMDEGAGLVAGDSSGVGNNGTIVAGAKAPTWVGADGGQWDSQNIQFAAGDSLNFDGVDDYVSLSPNDSLDGLAVGTYMAWVKQTAGATGWDSLFAADSGNCTNAFEIAMSEESGSSYFEVWAGAAATCYPKVFNGYIPVANPTAWHLVTYVVTDAGNEFYLDGVKKTVTYEAGNASSKYFFNQSSGGITKYYIGNSAEFGSEHLGEVFDGQMDEVRIYNRALTANEIKRYYLRSKYASPSPTASLIAAYGVSLSGPDFQGWAWGNNEVGWLSFNCLDRGAAVCTASNYRVYLTGPVNISPAVSDLTNNENSIDYCVDSFTAINLSWTFTDPDPADVNQTSYRVKITRSGDGVYYDSGIVTSNNPLISGSYIYGDIPANFSNGDNMGFLRYNPSGTEVYSWEVTVYDSAGASSATISSDPTSDFSFPRHQYPKVNFSPPLPATFIVDIPVQFCSSYGAGPCAAKANKTNESICYDDSNNEVICDSYSWDFDYNALDPSEPSSDSTDMNPVNTYTTSDPKNIVLVATDAAPTFYQCSSLISAGPKTLGSARPKWKEVVPK